MEDILPLLFALAFAGVMIASLWRVFEKAGEPGWAAIVPIYNLFVMLRIAGKPGWWILLMFIPVVSIVVGFLVLMGLAQRFGKGAGYAAGLMFLPFIFYPMLAFSDARANA